MNKPVAYIDPYDLERLPHYDCHIGSQQLKNGIPLYTHPVKELTLTQEEIHAVWASGEYYTLDKDGSIDEFHFADFAKAILRKAQSNCNGFCGEYECKENKTNCLRKAQEK